MLKKRPFHAYCIGMPRSGTHSIALMLSTSFSAAHEPAFRATILPLLWYMKKPKSAAAKRVFEIYLLLRDRVLNLAMEGAHYLHHLLPILVRIFPEAKFVFTVRDPYTWLESEINQNILTHDSRVYSMLEKYRYGRYNREFTNHETILKRIKNVYPIAAYLSYWRDHYETVRKYVPSERLLTLKTTDIKTSSAELAAFLGIPADTVDLSFAHSGAKRKKARKLYPHLDFNYIKDCVNNYCGEPSGQLFPDAAARLFATRY